MKKLLSLGFLTLCAALATERPADAWINSKFSIGLNWHFQSANNSYLWGLIRHGQNPPNGPYDGGYGGYGQNGMYGPTGPGGPIGPMGPGYGGFGIGAGSYGAGGYAYGAAAQPMMYFGGTGAAAPTAAPASPAAAPAASTQTPGPQTWQYNASPFQTTGYSPDAAANYYPTSYSNSVPSYWYGR